MGIDITQLLDEISRFPFLEKETPFPKLGTDTPSIRLVDPGVGNAGRLA